MDFTVLVSRPSLLRYFVQKSDGNPVTRVLGAPSDAPAAGTMFGDMVAGPLRAYFARNLQAPWNADGDPVAGINPANATRISTTLLPITTALGVVTGANTRYDTVEGVFNQLSVWGLAVAPLGVGPDAKVTNCIIEIRFNHSLA